MTYDVSDNTKSGSLRKLLGLVFPPLLDRLSSVLVCIKSEDITLLQHFRHADGKLGHRSHIAIFAVTLFLENSVNRQVLLKYFLWILWRSSAVSSAL